MPSTHISLLNRLGEKDETSWKAFAEIYIPLLRNWLKCHALTPADVEDLVQEVMIIVMNDIAQFEHNQRTGAFRKWLRLVTVNTARTYLRKLHKTDAPEFRELFERLDELEDSSSRLTRMFELEKRRALLRYLLDQVNKEFRPVTMAIFESHVLDELSVADTAARHRVSKTAVYSAKAHVLKRMREKGAIIFEIFDDAD